ncbi:DUF1289 domain-containing protein [Sphingomonas sp. MA1305]|uniref:DUF1289 domain-containing protein n=1 Tax=Sphingomonas sp. MA1305 TaxID=2479204 RepID=UPI0018DF917A|nr:DUF1289 domain-containing protein [Sphingomonas sp. MA1305]MBI0475405.1 DUF1289 domain-containing protein [Sphingomonas sp. MA1305]
MIELVPAEPISLASPCVNICTLDAATGWCRGCGRTIGEISNWSAKPAEERRAILAALPARMRTLGQPNL